MTVSSVIMWAYDAMIFFIILALACNLFGKWSFREQIVAFFVLYPFVFRVLLIK
jgi:hypothetical protein